MSSFFTRPASQKRKRAPTQSTAAKKRHKPQPAREKDDEEISGSESSGSERAASPTPSASSSADENETEASRRLKLAEQYLSNVRRDVAEDQNIDPEAFDAEEVDRELIAARLKEDVAEDKGRLYKRIASTLDWSAAESVRFGTDSQSLNGVAVDGAGKYAYTASKDCVVAKWELVPLAAAQGTDNTTPRRKPKQIAYRKGGTRKRAGDNKYKHHTAAILCIAASHDGNFVATGGADRRLIIWRASDLKPLRVFTHHRDAVLSLAFRGRTNQLFSAGKDRTVKIWSLNELAYVETLFGHQDEVVDVSAVGGGQERCVSVGGRDRTSRLWKVVEESQLVFRGGGFTSLGKRNQDEEKKDVNDEEEPPRAFEGSLDRVIQIDSQLFVTGSDNGSLSLYALYKKKPLHVLPMSHGYDPALSAELSWAEADVSGRKTNAQPIPRYVTAMACVPFSDLFMTGSWDGYIRVWRLSEDMKRIERVGVAGREALQEKINFENALQDGEIGIEGQRKQSTTEGPVRGVVNDLKVVEIGERGKDSIRVVAAVGKEMRTGRWLQKKGKNTAVLFEIPKL